MSILLGWLGGIGTAWLCCKAWSRLNGKGWGKTQPRKKKGGFITKTQEAWAQTRNFLYYDGTAMPEIKTYKEELDD